MNIVKDNNILITDAYYIVTLTVNLLIDSIKLKYN